VSCSTACFVLSVCSWVTVWLMMIYLGLVPAENCVNLWSKKIRESSWAREKSSLMTPSLSCVVAVNAALIAIVSSFDPIRSFFRRRRFCYRGPSPGFRALCAEPLFLVAGFNVFRLTLLFVSVAGFIALRHGWLFPLGGTPWAQFARPLLPSSHNL